MATYHELKDAGVEFVKEPKSVRALDGVRVRLHHQPQPRSTWTTVAAACGALSATASLAIARKGTPGVLEEAEAMQRIAGS